MTIVQVFALIFARQKTLFLQNLAKYSALKRLIFYGSTIGIEPKNIIHGSCFKHGFCTWPAWINYFWCRCVIHTHHLKIFLMPTNEFGQSIKYQRCAPNYTLPKKKQHWHGSINQTWVRNSFEIGFTKLVLLSTRMPILSFRTSDRACHEQNHQ